MPKFRIKVERRITTTLQAKTWVQAETEEDAQEIAYQMANDDELNFVRVDEDSDFDKAEVLDEIGDDDEPGDENDREHCDDGDYMPELERPFDH